MARRTSKKSAAAHAGTNGSAEGGRVNKAEKIREAAKAMGKNVRPRDLIAALASDGIEVSSAQVSATLKALGYRRRRRGRKAAAAAGAHPKAASSGHLDINALIAAKALIEKVGSVEKAKEALNALQKLQ